MGEAEEEGEAAAEEQQRHAQEAERGVPSMQTSPVLCGHQGVGGAHGRLGRGHFSVNLILK